MSEPTPTPTFPFPTAYIETNALLAVMSEMEDMAKANLAPLTRERLLNLAYAAEALTSVAYAMAADGRS